MKQASPADIHVKTFVVTIILLVMRPGVKFCCPSKQCADQLSVLIVENCKLRTVSEIQFVQNNTEIISYGSLT